MHVQPMHAVVASSVVRAGVRAGSHLWCVFISVFVGVIFLNVLSSQAYLCDEVHM